MDISFLIPVYNAGTHLEECIRSIVSQAPESYEIVAINDASTDDSHDRLLALSRVYPQLRVCENAENSGVSYTRNRLIEEAAGRYVWFVDADDMLAPKAAPFLLELADTYDADYMSGDFVKVAETASFDESAVPDHSRVTVQQNEDFGKSAPQNAVTKIGFSGIWGGLIRRSFLTDNEIRFREDLRWQEDTMFFFEASLAECRSFHCNAVCYQYRTNASSLTHARSNARCQEYYTCMCRFCAILQAYAKDTSLPEARQEQVRVKLYHMQESLAFTLCMVTDPDFVRLEMQALRQKGLFPYKGRKEALRTPNLSLAKRLALYMMHSGFAWRLMHAVYCLKNKAR